MGGRARTVLAVVAVLLVLGVPLAFLFASGGDDKPPPAKAAAQELRLELSTSVPELLVYVEPPANEPERAGGARSVTLRCVDAGGQLVAAQDEAWPFADTDSNTADPHAHITLDPERMGQVRSCRLVGTEPALEGSVP